MDAMGGREQWSARKRDRVIVGSYKQPLQHLARRPSATTIRLSRLSAAFAPRQDKRAGAGGRAARVRERTPAPGWNDQLSTTRARLGLSCAEREGDRYAPPSLPLCTFTSSLPDTSTHRLRSMRRDMVGGHGKARAGAVS